MLAQARNNTDSILEIYRRELHTLSDKSSLSDAFDEVLHQREHIMVIIDEYGGMEGHSDHGRCLGNLARAGDNG